LVAAGADFITQNQIPDRPIKPGFIISNFFDLGKEAPLGVVGVYDRSVISHLEQELNQIKRETFGLPIEAECWEVRSGLNQFQVFLSLFRQIFRDRPL
jgi:hypothetical protein